MTDADVSAWIRDVGLATLVPTASLPSLFTAVTGEAAVSRWWSHPRGGEVFRAGEVLDDDPDVRVVRLAEGKVTFLHRALWPALLGVVSDPGFAARATSGLDPVCRRVFDEVVTRRRVRLDHLAAVDGMPPRKALGKARTTLVGRLALFDHQVHTEAGRHEPILMVWDEAGLDVAPLPFDDARSALLAALRDARSVLTG